MKFILRHRDIFLVLLALCVQLGIFFYLSAHAEQLTPPGRVHTLYPFDYYYPDFIRQGALGSWSIQDMHTTEPTPKIYSYIFFVLSGKIASVFSIDAVMMYQITRITGGIVLFLSTYWFITLLLPQPLRMLAVLFALIIDTGPLWESVRTLPVWQWTAATPGQTLIAHRFFGFPHHLWGEAMGLALISLILRHIKSPSRLTLFGITCLALLGTSTSPPYFVILASCLFLPWLLYACVTKNLKQTFLPIVISLVAILIAGLWIKFEFAKGAPWNAFVQVEKSWWTTDSVLFSFIQSLSLFYPYVAVLLFFLPAYWSRWSPQIRQAIVLCLSWTMIPFVLIYLSSADWFPIVNGRIASDVTSVPIGILASIAMYTILNNKHMHRIFRSIILIIFTALIYLSLILSASYIKQYMDQQVYESYGPMQWYYYPNKVFWDGMMAVKTLPPYSNIMVLPTAGETLPAYMPIRVYGAMPHSFLSWVERNIVSQRFYTGSMTRDEAIALLKDNAISYVFYGPEEQKNTYTKTFYPDILEEVYSNPEVKIFKIRTD